VRFTVDPWAPEYGSSIERGVPELADPESPADLAAEVAVDEWRPMAVQSELAAGVEVLFVDGVRRIDARLWLDDAEGTTRTGLCASYAAGVVRCGDRAEVEHVEVERRLFGPAGVESLDLRGGLRYRAGVVPADDLDTLINEMQQAMRGLERRVAAEASPSDLMVLDGPLSSTSPDGAVGYVKSHHVGYLPPQLQGVIPCLGAGERTPLFVTQTARWSRYSWYLRLAPGAAHPWDGVVRCEMAADDDLEAARLRATLASAVLPRFASARHKDPRAPQNLYAIAGLERELRRRLGDRDLLYRRLVEAAAHRSQRTAP
jgi:hypothetical protein